LTAESGIFPCLFPHGEGFNTGAMRMLDYIKLRWQQLLSPFSLLKTYALVMAQVMPRSIIDMQLLSIPPNLHILNTLQMNA
jgi:hypothetical protein